MEYPEKSFAERSAKFAMTALAAAVIMTVSSSIAHAEKAEAFVADSESIVPQETHQLPEKNTSESKNREQNPTPKESDVSKDFQLYRQVAGLGPSGSMPGKELKSSDPREGSLNPDDQTRNQRKDNVPFQRGSAKKLTEDHIIADKSELTQIPGRGPLTAKERGWILRAMERRRAREKARGGGLEDDGSFFEKENIGSGSPFGEEVALVDEKTRLEKREQDSLAQAEEERLAKEKAQFIREKYEVLKQADEKRIADEQASRLEEEKRSLEDKKRLENRKQEAQAQMEKKRKADEKAKTEKQKQYVLTLDDENKKAEQAEGEESKKEKGLVLVEPERKAVTKANKQKKDVAGVDKGKCKVEGQSKTIKQKVDKPKTAKEKQKVDKSVAATADMKKAAVVLTLAERLRLAEERRRISLESGVGESSPALAPGQNDLSTGQGNHESNTKSVVDILPSRPVTFQIASTDEAPKITNFDPAITRRFKVAGSYLDKGDHGNNIIKDNKGREFLNVMAFWDVLVEPQSDEENHYYGSIQFPLGSRHPAIIKSIKSGDALAEGCRANEVVVLKGFETEGIDYWNGLVDAYLAHSVEMSDGTLAFQEVVHQPSFSLINVETGCMSRDLFSRSDVDPKKMGHDKTLHALPVRE